MTSLVAKINENKSQVEKEEEANMFFNILEIAPTNRRKDYGNSFTNNSTLTSSPISSDGNNLVSGRFTLYSLKGSNALNPRFYGPILFSGACFISYETAISQEKKSLSIIIQESTGQEKLLLCLFFEEYFFIVKGSGVKSKLKKAIASGLGLSSMKPKNFSRLALKYRWKNADITILTDGSLSQNNRKSQVGNRSSSIFSSATEGMNESKCVIIGN